MKREINCIDCAASWKKHTKGAAMRQTISGGLHAERFELPEGEAMVVVVGALKRDCLCDGCNAELNSGTIAAAVSVLGNGRAHTYYSWEGSALKSPEMG